MKTAFLSILLSLFLPIAASADCVLLLHGLARSSTSLKAMEIALKADGYTTVNTSYPSTKASVEELTASVLPDAIAKCGKDKVHFVTHSMGGILVRAYLRDHQPENMGRVVMLGPPNQGSEIVNTFSDLKLFEWLNGPAGMELGMGPGHIPENLGPASFEVGIIAGKLSVSPVFSYVIEGKDDGKVSISSTKLDGMQDHIVMPTTHTFMMLNPFVIAQTMIFLETGSFDKDLKLKDFIKEKLPSVLN